MPQNWRQAYAKLTDFIAEHPEIKIGSNVVRINKTVRPEFHQLFRIARESFIKEKSQALITEAEVLSKKYVKIEEEVIRLLGLERIVLFPQVDTFLHNPMEEFVRELNSPLFNLLKHRIDITSYEKEASYIVTSSFKSLFQQGYEIWMVLSLIKLLQADKLFRVYADIFDNDEYFRHGGGTQVKVPKPEEQKEISFKHNPQIGILVADQIVHSVKLGCYFSFRPHIVEPQGEAINKSMKREWLPLPNRTIINIDRNVILVYMDKELEELSLIADLRFVCRPDLIIGCIGLEKIFNEKSLARIEKCNEDLRPKLGTYIISNEPIMEEMTEDKKAGVISNELTTEKILLEEKNIHFLPINYDQSKLEQIINLFTPKEITSDIEY